MKLDRNDNLDGKGKYTLINNRTNKVEYGITDHEDEFFVIKLKDKFAEQALLAYASAAETVDREWANEVRELASRSGLNSPFCKKPD